MDIPVSQLSVQYIDMVRVRNTPQPVCFRALLHLFTLIYLLLLPLISYDALGYLVIPEGERAGFDCTRHSRRAKKTIPPIRSNISVPNFSKTDPFRRKRATCIVVRPNRLPIIVGQRACMIQALDSLADCTLLLWPPSLAMPPATAFAAVLLTSYLMLSLQIAADHLENPFGRDEYDHDLDEVRRLPLSCVL